MINWWWMVKKIEKRIFHDSIFLNPVTAKNPTEMKNLILSSFLIHHSIFSKIKPIRKALIN